MSSRPSVLVCTPLREEALALLRERADVDVLPDLSHAELAAHLPAYHVVVVGGETTLSADLIEAGHNLRAIACTESRLERIDVSAARDFGIEVLSAVAGTTVAVAEQTLMLLLQLANGPLAGKTLGVVGFGRIGQQVARRARAFNMRVLVNQPRLTPQLVLESNVEACDLPRLLRESDFVTLHVPYRAGKPPILDAAAIGRLHAGAIVLNLGHRDLIDQTALLAALRDGRLAAAAGLAEETPTGELPPNYFAVQRLGSNQHDHAHLALARRLLTILRTRRPSESLSLDIVPIELVMPHEAFDQKRVDRLKASLDEEGVLVNPPLVTPWAGKYVILDGATRFNALKQAGYPHIAVQLVAPTDDFTLHTWYHAISNERPITELWPLLAALPNIVLEAAAADDWHDLLSEADVLCYFIDRDERVMVARVVNLDDRLRAMNALVACYTEWGSVERTLLTDIGRLLGQFPQLAAVAIFPQFAPEDVFNVARHGQLLPAGLTRFVIPGRVLHLNVRLSLLKSPDPLPTKRAWLNTYLADKLARSRIRYYQEPVILIDA